MFKKFLLGLGLVAVATVPAQADLLITEVVDATLPGGLPKFVEITNTSDEAIDLSLYSIGNYSNGGVTLGGGSSTQLSGILGTCESYVISYETGDAPGVGLFFDTYGFDPDNFDLGAFFNGDDVLALFRGVATGDGSDAVLIDVYGEIGVDGTGTVWEYTDGYAYRLVNTNSDVFDPAQWAIGGPNSLETGDDITELDLILQLTNPGVFESCTPVSDETSTFGDLKSRF